MSNPTPSAEELQIEVERYGNNAVVRLIGSANMETAADLKERLVELADTPFDRLVLDLAGLAFVSSVGLGAIIAAHLRCRHHHCEVRLVAPQPKIMELLEVTRLTRLFTIHPSVESALAAH